MNFPTSLRAFWKKLSKAAIPLAVATLFAGAAMSAHAKDDGDSSARSPQGHRSGTVKTADGDIYYEMYGSGTPVILLAGGPGASHTSLRPEFDKLADKHTVVYLDNIGRGRSSDLPAGRHHSPYRDAEDVEKLRQALGFQKFVLIGHSYGGRPAMAYAVRHPDRLTHLVLSSSGYSHESSQRNIDAVNRFIASQYPEIWDQLLQMRAQGIKTCDPRYQELYGAPISQLYWHDSSKMRTRPKVATGPEDRFRLNVYCDILGDDPEVVVGGSMASFDIRAALANVHVPTLVTSGRHDLIVPPREAREIVRAFPPGVASLLIFENSAHRPWVEEGELYFSKLNAFLDQSPSSGR
ncbi:MAG: alpha/beta fold hydrolase [Telluria sp.]